MPMLFLIYRYNCPKEEEISILEKHSTEEDSNINILAYNIIKRGGWIASSQKEEYLSHR